MPWWNVSISSTLISVNQTAASAIGRAGLGIDNGATVTLNNDKLNNNVDTATNSTGGGGIYIQDATSSLVINNTQVTNNSTSAVGGGLYAIDTTVTLKNGSLVDGNTAQSGGGIYADASATVNIVGSTVSNNTATIGDGLAGGGIFNNGTVNISAFSSISGNKASGTSGFGAGILNEALLNIDHSTIANNITDSYGGGIYSSTNVAVTTITASTISGNKAALGGGVRVSNGSASLTNTTISGNTAFRGSPGNGGGIEMVSLGTLTLLNDTLYNNNGIGANLFANKGTVNTENTIFANANGNNGADSDISGTIVSHGHNLIQNAAGATGFVGSDITKTDPVLYPLSNWRGSLLQTNPPKGGSPVIDAGDNAGCPSTDELDQKRLVLLVGMCDIGAIEYNGIPAAPPPPPSAAPIVHSASATPTRTPSATPSPTYTPKPPSATVTLTPSATFNPTPLRPPRATLPGATRMPTDAPGS